MHFGLLMTWVLRIWFLRIFVRPKKTHESSIFRNDFISLSYHWSMLDIILDREVDYFRSKIVYSQYIYQQNFENFDEAKLFQKAIFYSLVHHFYLTAVNRRVCFVHVEKIFFVEKTISELTWHEFSVKTSQN